MQYPSCQWLRHMQSSMVSGALTTIAREFYEQRNEYIQRLKGMDVFPLSIANQGRTYRRRANMINILGQNIFCHIMHLKK